MSDAAREKGPTARPSGRLRPPQVAEKYEISESTLAKYRNKGIGPRFIKLGGRIFYREVDLEAWVEANVVETDFTRKAAAA